MSRLTMRRTDSWIIRCSLVSWKSMRRTPMPLVSALVSGESFRVVPQTSARDQLFSEARLSLLAKRRAAFLGFRGPVIESQRLHSHTGDAPDVFRVRIEGAFSNRNGGGAALADLRAPFFDLGVELVIRHDLVNEPHGG